MGGGNKIDFVCLESSGQSIPIITINHCTIIMSFKLTLDFPSENEWNSGSVESSYIEPSYYTPGSPICLHPRRPSGRIYTNYSLEEEILRESELITDVVYDDEGYPCSYPSHKYIQSLQLQRDTNSRRCVYSPKRPYRTNPSNLRQIYIDGPIEANPAAEPGTKKDEYIEQAFRSLHQAIQTQRK